jgi:hypothetical protein
MNTTIKCLLLTLHIAIVLQLNAQIAPSEYENIDYLITFGKDADKKWGDDDNVQVHFFVIPKEETAPVYIRVYDPETSGKYDTKNKEFNSTTKYRILGGEGAFSTKAARNINPIKGYDKGRLILSKNFGNTTQYDGKWYSFGPINPSEGEYSKKFKGYIFKMICEGTSGDDGNAYKYALSYSKTENIPVENGNIFTYEMSFHLKSKVTSTAHIYPFIEEGIIAITQYNFDADDDLEMRLTSIARKLIPLKSSADGQWISNTLKILEKEVNTSLDLQLVKQSASGNDMVVHILNQYKEAVPLFSIPIGGKPKYKYNVKVKTTF